MTPSKYRELITLKAENPVDQPSDPDFRIPPL